MQILKLQVVLDLSMSLSLILRFQVPDLFQAMLAAYQD